MPESLIARVLAYADAKQLAIMRRSPTWLRKPSANLLPSQALRVAVVAVGSLLVGRDEPVLGHRGVAPCELLVDRGEQFGFGRD